MKKYIGTKQIEAEPMTLGEFIKISGRNPYANSEDVHGDNEEGYLVEYEDNYKSWSPKDVFDKAYRVAETAEDRMAIEIDELEERAAKLFCFIRSPKYESLDELTKAYLDVQWGCMNDYIDLLERRLERMQGKEQSDDKSMKFGIAMQMAANGIPVRRKGWNENFVLIKQVFSHVDLIDIPSTKGLPKAVKELLMGKGRGLNYDVQLIVCDTEWGRVNSYIPTMDDIFTNDWSVVPYEGYLNKKLLNIFHGGTEVGAMEVQDDDTAMRRDFFNIEKIRQDIKKEGIKPEYREVRAIMKIHKSDFFNDEKQLNTFCRYLCEEDDEKAEEIKGEINAIYENKDDGAYEFILKHTDDKLNFAVTEAHEDYVKQKAPFSRQELTFAFFRVFPPIHWPNMFSIIDYVITGEPKCLAETFKTKKDEKRNI